MLTIERAPGGGNGENNLLADVAASAAVRIWRKYMSVSQGEARIDEGKWLELLIRGEGECGWRLLPYVEEARQAEGGRASMQCNQGEACVMVARAGTRPLAATAWLARRLIDEARCLLARR